MREHPYKKQSIDLLVAAAEHIRDCERRRRVYGAAFDAAIEKNRLPPPLQHLDRMIDSGATRGAYQLERRLKQTF